MNIKNLYISAGVLLTLSAIIALSGNSGSNIDDDERIAKKLIDKESLAGLASIEINADDRLLNIEKDDTSKKWLAQQAHNMPIEFSRISTLVDDITEAQIQRVASSKKERHDDLGLNGSDTITFKDKSGQVIQRIEFGKGADNNRQIIRYADEEKSYLIDQNISLNSEATDWLDKTLLSIESDKVIGLSIETSEKQTLALSRKNSEENWSAEGLDGRTINQEAISSFLGQLDSLRFNDLGSLDTEEVVSAKEHSFTSQFTLKDGPTYTVAIGRRPEVKAEKSEDSEEESEDQPAGPVYVSVKSSDLADPINQYSDKTAFEISSYLYGNLVKSIEDLTEEVEVEEAALTETEPTMEENEAEGSSE